MSSSFQLDQPAVQVVEPTPPAVGGAPPPRVWQALSLLLIMAAVVVAGLAIARAVLVDAEDAARVTEPREQAFDAREVAVVSQTAPRRWTETGFAMTTAFGELQWEQATLIPDAKGRTVTNPVWTDNGFVLLTEGEGALQLWTSPAGREWDIIGQAAIEPGITITGLDLTAEAVRVLVEDDAGSVSRQPIPGLVPGFSVPNALADSEVVFSESVATSVGLGNSHLALVNEFADCCDDLPPITGAWAAAGGSGWTRLTGVEGQRTLGDRAGAGPAGWAFTWHQCDPGCGQEVWLSPDLMSWDRLRLSNSARDQVLFQVSGISVGTESVVVSGLASDSSPYTGRSAAIVWVGTIKPE